MDVKQVAQPIFTFFFEHAQATSLLSAVTSLIFALVIFLLLRRFKVPQNDAWARPFAWAFLVLALIHSLGPLAFLLVRGGMPPDYPDAAGYLVAAIGSGATNYLFFLAGIRLAGKRGRVDAAIRRFFQLIPASSKHVKFAVIALLVIASLVSAGADLRIKNPSAWSDWWLLARFPDVLFSVPALVFMGVVLYHNVTSRRDQRMAFLALMTLLAAVLYAFFYAVYGTHPLIVDAGLADWLSQSTNEFRAGALDAAVVSISLPFKFGLFFSAFTVVLLIADPAAGIRRLLKNVTHGPAEFLAHDGVVRSIQEEIGVSRVQLYIALPGSGGRKVTRYRSPHANGPAEQPEEIQFDERTDYGWVMGGPGRVIHRRPFDYSGVVSEDVRLTPRASVIAVPILFHGAIVGCLKADLDDGKFTEADLQNFYRFAALLAPAVQTYRQEEASKVLSRRLTYLQLSARDYDIARDIEGVASVAQDILAPSATAISIKAGFRRHAACDAVDAACRQLIERQPDAPEADTVTAAGGETLVLLPRELKVESRELKDTPDGEQVIGTLLFAVPPVPDQTGRTPTLVSSPFNSRVVSSLITDALLNFIRGSLNEVTRQLSIRMIRLEVAKAPAAAEATGELVRQANVPSWFETMNETAREADLLWAAARYSSKQEWLGEQVELIKELEGRGGLWREKVQHDEYANNLDIALCTLRPAAGELTHVIRISLRGSEQTIWLGVGNPAFGRELDYLSPWMGFVLRFGEIAHTNLKQILLKQNQERLEKEAAEAIGIATVMVSTATFIHQMVNQVRDLTAPLTLLTEWVKRGSLLCNDRQRETILSLSGAAGEIIKTMQLFSGATKPDERRPCSLAEAYQHAVALTQTGLARYNIRVRAANLDGHVLDVPFYVAAYALANLFNNARDAIRDGKVKNGLIEVGAEPKDTMIECHVTDNGPGIPPGVVEQLFERSAISSKRQGSGLGLYLTAHSLRENRGAIKLTSRGPSPPTTFTLCFPKQRRD